MLELFDMCRNCYMRMLSCEFVGVVLLVFALAEMRFTGFLLFFSVIYFWLAENVRKNCSFDSK
jgi:apolipoprotein N-acyltransferase